MDVCRLHYRVSFLMFHLFMYTIYREKLKSSKHGLHVGKNVSDVVTVSSDGVLGHPIVIH